MAGATITLLGTGSPIPDPDRAGPATLVQLGGESYLVDAGRGVGMRLAAAGTGPNQLTAVLITHLHSDHITDLGDIITTRWVTTFEPAPLDVIGPPGTAAVVDAVLASLEPDIRYRIAHHDDIDAGPDVRVHEVLDGPVEALAAAKITVAPTDHRPVEPSIAFRIERDGTAVVAAGDTNPCAGLDALCTGADAVIHTVVRKDVIDKIPIPRLQDVVDYHSSVEEAAGTAARADVGTLVLTHYVPAIPPGGEEDWRAQAAAHFTGRIEIGADLHRVEV